MTRKNHDGTRPLVVAEAPPVREQSSNDIDAAVARFDASAAGSGGDHPCLRSDLEVSVQGSGAWSIRKPESSIAFTLHDVEWKAAQLLDGKRSFDELVVELAEQGITAAPGAARAFLQELESYGFLVPLSVEPRQEHDLDAASPEERRLIDTAVALRTRGETEAAVDYLVAALEINPSNHHARALVRAWQSAATSLPLRRADAAQEPPPEVAPAPETSMEGHLDERDSVLDEHRRTLARKKRRRAMVGIAVVVLVGLGGTLIPWPMTVHADLVVEAFSDRTIHAPFAGRISTVTGREGEPVTAGQLLLTMDSADLLAERDMARAQLRGAQAELERLVRGHRAVEIAKARQEVAIREANFAFAKDELRRRSLGAGVVSESELGEWRRAVEVASNELAQAQAEVALLEAGSREEVVKMQRAKVDEGEARLALLEKRIEQARLVSPIAGTITTANPEKLAGQVVGQGMELLRVSDAERVRVELAVYEADIGAIRDGQPLEFWLYAEPGRRLNARVESISPRGSPRELSTGVYFTVLAFVENPERTLRPGLRGRGRVEVGRSTLATVLLRPFVTTLRQLDLAP